MSDLDRHLQEFFLPLMAFHGISTWQEAALLAVESPCFDRVPPALTVRFLATMRPLAPEELALLELSKGNRKGLCQQGPSVRWGNVRYQELQSCARLRISMDYVAVADDAVRDSTDERGFS
ncbi:hypothetical protein JKP88DRAFT_281604 [Tribonema minus]|uniref:Uncharacterized protein n=1 Tax=Tribonema minus TaxID=303371 RepID=A0A836C981_9STRA|nr:hypothetical protein JKP88DRAFT_281604 [Tribonema minus]